MTARRYELHFSLVNEDQGYIFSEWSEPLDVSSVVPELVNDDGAPNFGAIYRQAQSEYGRCMSSVYVDRVDGPPMRVGWYFVSRQRYEDTGKPYLRGAWVTVREVEPATVRYVGMDR